MKNILISLIILGNAFFFYTVEAQPNTDEAKRAYNFSDWPGKNGNVIPRIDLIKENISIFQTAIESDNHNDRFMINDVGEIYVISYNYRWSIFSDWDVQIRMVVAGSCEDAHEYLILRFINRTMPAMSVRDVPTVAGDISFDNGFFFIRNNLVFEIYAFGDMRGKTADIARQIDEVLLKKPTINPGSSYKPVVSKIDFIRVPNTADRYPTVKVIPFVTDPLGGTISIKPIYRNGSESFHIIEDTWYYCLYEPGTSEPALIFISDSGFNTVVKLNITATDTDIYLTPSAVSVEDRPAESPQVFTLSQNAPNPFNSATVIEFCLVRAAEVRLAVYDALGRMVAVPAEGSFPAGRHAVLWDGRDDRGIPVSSGVYLYRLTAGGKAETRRMTIVR